MSESIATLGALFGFMLLPVWIPVVAVAAGALIDACRGRGERAARRVPRRAVRRDAALQPRAAR